MADLSITPANVRPLAGSVQETGVAGELILGGSPVYKSDTTGKYMLADNNVASAIGRRPIGISAQASAAADQPLTIVRQGPINLGAVLTPGTDYYLSNTAGGICPRADLTTGEYVVLLGLAAFTTVLNVDIQYPDVATA